MMNQPPASFRDDLKTIGRGVLMGAADVIPGVSGGTIALILGIYERLVHALSRYDLALLDLLRRRQWRAVVTHLDLRFLIALGSGIAGGILGLASVMNYLLAQHAVPTWAFLFGLILASSLLVARMVQPWSGAAVVSAVIGAGFAYWLVGQLPAEAQAGLPYVFFCGMVAICAMILPGISGAFVLVIMGMYFYITGVLSNAMKGDWSFDNLATIVVFCAGCAIGLTSFSKFLRWLLNRHEAVTLAALGGFMVGSLRKIWPFKQDATTVEHLQRLGVPEAEIAHFQESPAGLEMKYRLLENYFPSELSGEMIFALGLTLAAILFVLGLDWYGSPPRHVPPLDAAEGGE